MPTTLFLVRNGSTPWSREGRVAGRRDIGLSDEGRAETEGVAARLASLELSEVLTSPLPRAVQTAEQIAAPHRLDVARDPRLIDFDAGTWEAQSHAEVASSAAYQSFLADPLSSGIPSGEALEAARDRVVASVGQALEDNELGANVVMVSHAGPLRVLVAHYLGMSLATYHRIRLSPGSISVLRFEAETGVPRVLAINCPVGDLSAVLR